MTFWDLQFAREASHGLPDISDGVHSGLQVQEDTVNFQGGEVEGNSHGISSIADSLKGILILLIGNSRQKLEARLMALLTPLFSKVMKFLMGTVATLPVLKAALLTGHSRLNNVSCKFTSIPVFVC